VGYGEDMLQVASGRVALGLFHAKYGLWVTVLSVGLPILLVAALLQSLLRWLLAPIVSLLRALGWLARRPSQSGR
jgi:antibiotic biosynthesis monooxygenase (ABM) superfamily enzyme